MSKIIKTSATISKEVQQFDNQLTSLFDSLKVPGSVYIQSIVLQQSGEHQQFLFFVIS